MSKQKKNAPVIAVINMKGGVGKTTISGNVFREAFRGHRIKTLLIDFDAQLNLTQLLLKRPDYEAVKTKKQTLWHVFEPDPNVTVFETSESDVATVKSATKFTRRLKYLIGHQTVELHLLAGDFRVARLNLREKPETLRLPRLRFASLTSKAREEFDLVVLDCNPSSSFMTRCAIENCTHLLVPVKPDKYSVFGLELITEYLDGLPDLSSLPEIIVLMNGTSPALSREEAQIRSHTKFGPAVMVKTIPQTKVLAARSDYTGFAVDRKVAYSKTTQRILAAVARELLAKIGILP